MEQKEIKIFKKNLPLLAILLCLGIIFLFAAEYDSNESTGTAQADFDEDAYTEKLERRLCEMIEGMEGVSEVKVMITLEGSSRYQFAQKESGDMSGTSVSTFLMQEGTSGTETPVLIEIGAPKIKGVSVVCRGAENVLIREKILGLVAGNLNLTKNKIYVTQ